MQSLSDCLSIIHIDTDDTDIANSNILAITVLIAKVQQNRPQISLDQSHVYHAVNIFNTVTCTGLNDILLFNNHLVQIQQLETFYIKNEDVYNSVISYSLNEISDSYRNEHGSDINNVLNVVHSLIENTYVFIFNDTISKQLINKYRPDFFLREDGTTIATHNIQIFETESHISAMQRVLYYYGKKDFIYTAKGIESLETSSKRNAYIKFLLTLHDVLGLSIRWYLTECEPYVPVIVSGKYKNKRIDEVIETDSKWINSFIQNNERMNENYIREYVCHHYMQ